MIELGQVVHLKGQLQLSKLSFAEQLTEEAAESRGQNTGSRDQQIPTTPLSGRDLGKFLNTPEPRFHHL